MDWVKKLEEEQKRRAEDEREDERAKLEWSRKEETQFAPIRERLMLLLEAAIAELRRKTGIALTMDTNDTNITVRIPKKQHSGCIFIVFENWFIISFGRYERSDVHVELHKNTHWDKGCNRRIH